MAYPIQPTIVALPDPGPNASEYDVDLQRTLVKLFAAINRSIQTLAALPGVTSGSAAPTTGSHNSSEFVWNTNVSLLGLVGSRYVLLGWSCTVAGTPGIWSECRVLTGG